MKRLQELVYGKDAVFGLRKRTTPVHWFVGALFATISTFLYFPAGLALMGIFAAEEVWNDWEIGTREGCSDWWEAWAVYVGYLAIIAVPLNLAGVILTRWI